MPDICHSLKGRPSMKVSNGLIGFIAEGDGVINGDIGGNLWTYVPRSGCISHIT